MLKAELWLLCSTPELRPNWTKERLRRQFSADNSDGPHHVTLVQSCRSLRDEPRSAMQDNAAVKEEAHGSVGEWRGLGVD